MGKGGWGGGEKREDDDYDTTVHWIPPAAYIE
jgi:hypothetical protein